MKSSAINRATFAERIEDVEQKIFDPYRDPGIQFFDQPEWIWRKVPSANFWCYATSSHESQQTQLLRDVHRINGGPPRHNLMYNQSIIHVDDATVEDMIKIGEKQLVMFRKKQKARTEFRKKLQEFFGFKKELNDLENAELMLTDQPSLSELSQASEARLTMPGMQNYFHGVWENLPQLVPFQDAKFRGRIIVRHSLPDLPKFAQDIISLIFPDIVDRVEVFHAKPGPDYIKSRRCRNFVTGFDWSFYAQLAAGPELDIGLPEDAKELNIFHRPDSYAFFFSFANSYTVNQKAFRDRAVKAIEGMDFSHLPKRFWVSRAGSSRRPSMRDEQLLTEELSYYGLEKVRLEELSVAEQIGIFFNAEIVGSQHGAGMTNLMFASPNTYVFEVGHGLTIERWRAFHPLAAISGCQYESFFTDYANDRPTERPDIRSDGFPVPDCTDVLIDKVLERVDAVSSAQQS